VNADTRIFLFMNRLAGKSRAGDILIALVGEYLAYALVALFLLFLAFSPSFEGRWLSAFSTVFLAALISRFVFASLIRRFYKRHRPFTVYKVNNVLTEKSFSFPSGHSTFFYAFSTAIYMYDKDLGIFFIISTVIMTIFRVVAGVHYLTDILGGLAIGVLTGYFTFLYLGPLIRLVIKL
jgi:undecaprenyl-diphosphatase